MPPLLCAKGGLWVMRDDLKRGSLGLRQEHAGCTVKGGMSPVAEGLGAGLVTDLDGAERTQGTEPTPGIST